MNEKYKKNLEKSLNNFQKRYYSMDASPTDGSRTDGSAATHRRPTLRRSRMSPSILNETLDSVQTTHAPSETESAMARYDATNAVKKQIEAEERQSR